MITQARRRPAGRTKSQIKSRKTTIISRWSVRWGAHDVQLHRTGVKHIRHPIAGDLHLSYEVMELTADPGVALVAFSAKRAHPPTTLSGSSPAGQPPTSQPMPWQRRTRRSPAGAGRTGTAGPGPAASRRHTWLAAGPTA